MFQFPGLTRALRPVTRVAPRRVAPFGNPGITASLQLPQAYRSLPRPSSPPCAKASTVRPYALDLIVLGVIPQHHTHHASVVKERTTLSVFRHPSSVTTDNGARTTDHVLTIECGSAGDI